LPSLNERQQNAPPHDNTEMLTIVTLLVAVLALMVSAAALAIAWFQLRLQRDAAGGRGFIFDIARVTPLTDAATIPWYRVLVKFIGNERTEVSLHLERDGLPCDPDELGFQKPPPLRHQMSGNDGPLIWIFDLHEDVADGLWCVLTWVEPYGDAVRTCAFRRRLGDDPQYEEWRWYRFLRERRRIESWGGRQRWSLIKRVVGKARSLGHWRPYRLRPLQPGQAPIGSEVNVALIPEMQRLILTPEMQRQILTPEMQDQILTPEMQDQILTPEMQDQILTPEMQFEKIQY
jgi:hypothetical protein